MLMSQTVLKGQSKKRHSCYTRQKKKKKKKEPYSMFLQHKLGVSLSVCCSPHNRLELNNRRTLRLIFTHSELTTSSETRDR